MEQAKLESILRLIKLLVNNSRYKIPEIAERLNVASRTVERYIQILRNAGFIVHHPKGGVPYLEKHTPFFKEISKLIHFTDAETNVVRSVVEAIDDANPLKGEIRRKLYNSHELPYTPELVVLESDCINIHLIQEAIETEKQVLLKSYRSANSNDVTDRVIEPFAFTTNYLQVWGYEVGAELCKLFKIARIGEVQILKNRWKYNHKHKVGAVDLFKMTGDKLYHIELILNLRAYNLLIEEYPKSRRHIEQIANNQYILKTEVFKLEAVGRFVLGLLSDITVQNSPELVAFLKKALSQANF